MPAILVAMILLLVLVGAVLGVVIVGMQGRGRDRAPHLADRMARAARHLNGDGAPPQSLRRLFRSPRPKTH
jgi:UPF0716 family protein affecting phage T7 exclusion